MNGISEDTVKDSAHCCLQGFARNGRSEKSSTPFLTRIFRFAFLSFFCVGMLSSVTASAAGKKILFIGNSFSYRTVSGAAFNLATTVRDAATGGGFETPTTDIHAPGGWTLADHVNSSVTSNKIAQSSWDYVVIQQQSVASPICAVSSSERYWFFETAAALYDQAKAANSNATVILYETWSWKDEYVSTINSSYYCGDDAETMQERVSTAYHNLKQDLIDSGRTDVEIAHVGDAREVNRTNQDMNMYADKSHPNAAGVYVSTLVIYSTIYNADPMSNTYTGGLGTSDALYCRQVARFSADIPAPAPPAHVYTESGNTLVNLTWDASEKADTYSVKRSSVSGGPYSAVTNGLAGTNYTDTTVANDVTYYYVITGVNGDGESPEFWETAATPRETPLSPTGLSAEVTGTRTALRWDASEGATSYTVLRSGSVVAANITDTFYVDNGAESEDYSFTVTANNAIGSSPESDAVSVSTVQAAPSWVGVTNDGSNIMLEWRNHWPLDVAFSIKRSSSAAGPFVQIGTMVPVAPYYYRTYTDTNVTFGADYYYQVTVLNEAGESDPSPTWKAGWGSGITGDYYETTDFSGGIAVTRTDENIDSFLLYPGYIDNLPPEVTTDTYSVRWSGELESPLDETFTFSITAYDTASVYLNGVLKSTDGSFSQTLKAGRKYAIKVELRKTASSGPSGAFLYWKSASIPNDYVAIPSAYLYPAVSPSGNVPTNVTATPGNQQISLSWTGSQGAGSYKVKRAISSGGSYTTVATVSGTAYVDTGVSNGTTYYYIIVPVVSGSEGTASAEVSTAPVAPPSAPSRPVGLVANTSSNQIALSWTASAGATDYRIKRSAVSGGPYTVIASDVSGTAYADAGVVDGFAFYYVVSAVNSGVESADSDEAVASSGIEAWRQSYFGTSANSGSASDNADPDEDGLTNYEEYIAGTNPNDAASILTAGEVDESGNDIQVSFPTVVGKNYRVEYSDTLSNAWHTVQGNIVGTGGDVQVTDTNGLSNAIRFYRVVVY